MNIWLFIAVFEFIIIIFASIYLYRFAKIILNLQNIIEDSLDVLDEKYQSISLVLQKPVFFDSVEVRQVISDIASCQNAIYKIANNLTNTEMEDIENERKEEDS